MTRSTKLLVFVSHSSKDSELAKSVVDLLCGALGLRAEDVRCSSIDGFRPPAGANTDEQLKLELSAAETFISLITPNSLNSAYVLFELGARWGANRHMVPLLAWTSPDALRGPLGKFNALSAGNESHLYQLVTDIAGVLRREIQSPAFYTQYVTQVAQQANSMAGGTVQTAEPARFAGHASEPAGAKTIHDQSGGVYGGSINAETIIGGSVTQIDGDTVYTIKKSRRRS